MRPWLIPPLLLLCFAVAVGATGCGGDDRGEIEQVLSELRASYLDRDYESACSLLTRRAQRQIGGIGHEVPTTCVRDMARRMPGTVVSSRDLVEPELTDLEIDGDSASARTVNQGQPVAATFVRENDRWKADTVFGTSPARERPPVLRGSGYSSAGQRVGHSPARPCPAVSLGKITVRGGCEFRVDADMLLTTLTALGDRRYASCPLSFVIHVAPTGAVAVTTIGVSLTNVDRVDVCGDIYACRNSDGEPYPWRGGFSHDPDGRGTLRLTNFCLDTCIGRFVGPIAFRLSRTPTGHLVLNANTTGAGVSGLLMSGRWVLEPRASHSPVVFSR